MTSRIVCDASAIVAALLDAGDDGRWAAARLNGDLYSPSLLPYECGNVMRRLERAGEVSAEQAVQAHRDLLDLNIEYWPYHPLAQRIWELRDDLSSYDAAYIALAETVDATFVTLDARLTRSPGLRCGVESPGYR